MVKNGLLKKLALGTAIAGSALLGAKEAKAAPVNWNSFTQIVGSIPQEYSQNYLSVNSSILPQNCSGIYFLVTPLDNRIPIGGFDLINGQVTQSYFGQVGDKEKYTANSDPSENPNNSFEGYWQVFYRSAGGDLGVWETDDGGYFTDLSNELNPNQYNISNFTSYGSQNPGSFTFTTDVPEASTGALSALGIAALALRRKRNISTK